MPEPLESADEPGSPVHSTRKQDPLCLDPITGRRTPQVIRRREKSRDAKTCFVW